MTTDEAEPLTDAEETELAKEIELALAPYQGIAPPALLAMMREKLEEGLRTHSAPRSLLRRFAGRPEVESSGEVPILGAKPRSKAGGREGA